jgi:hypothetical protein
MKAFLARTVQRAEHLSLATLGVAALLNTQIGATPRQLFLFVVLCAPLTTILHALIERGWLRQGHN